LGANRRNGFHPKGLENVHHLLVQPLVRAVDLLFPFGLALDLLACKLEVIDEGDKLLRHTDLGVRPGLLNLSGRAFPEILEICLETYQLVLEVSDGSLRCSSTSLGIFQGYPESVDLGGSLVDEVPESFVVVRLQSLASRLWGKREKSMNGLDHPYQEHIIHKICGS